MSSVFRVIKVNITRQTKPIPQASFGVTAIIGENSNTGNRIDFYTDLSGVEAGLTGGVNTPEYKSASSYFSQSPQPAKVAIIHVDYPTESYTEALNDAVVVNADFYGVVEVSRDKDIQEEVADWVAANNRVCSLSSDDSAIVTLSDSQDSLNDCKFVLDADFEASNTIDMTINTADITQVTYATDHLTTMGLLIAAISALADITATLDPTDANNRTILINNAVAPVSIDSVTIAGGAGQPGYTITYATLAAQLKAKANDRTLGFYHGSASTEYLDSGSLGKLLTWNPGTYTPAYKTVIGSTVDDLEEGQAQNAHDKYWNTYEELGGVNGILFGYVPSGEDFDIIVFQDWLRSRLAENVFGLLAREKKVAFTDPDITKIESKMMEIFEIGLARGAITPFAYDTQTNKQIGGYKIWMPAAEDVTQNDKAAHILRDVKFKCWYSNAIHKVVIDGTITI